MGGSVEKRRRRPVIACETVEGRGTCHDAERAGAAGVDVPDDDDVGVWSWSLMVLAADIIENFETSSCRSYEAEY